MSQDLAEESAAPGLEAVPTEPFILFEVAGATYALRSSQIQRLEMVQAITPVPNAPSFVDGVVSVRGQVLPVVNLRARFGFARVPPDLRARLVVVRVVGRSVGFLVDQAREFAAIAQGAVRPPPEGISTLNGRYLEGVVHLGERLVLVLAVEDLLDPDADNFDPTTFSVPDPGAGE